MRVLTEAHRRQGWHLGFICNPEVLERCVQALLLGWQLRQLGRILRVSNSTQVEIVDDLLKACRIHIEKNPTSAVSEKFVFPTATEQRCQAGPLEMGERLPANCDRSATNIQLELVSSGHVTATVLCREVILSFLELLEALVLLFDLLLEHLIRLLEAR